MMERRVIVICCIVGFLGLLSAATGLGAEAKRIKSSQVQVISSDASCRYPRSPALALGFTAALALLVAQIIINYETGCICCRRGPRPSTSKWTLSIVCFVVSWFTFVLGFLIFLAGAALNDARSDESMYSRSYYCYVVKPGVFSTGSILSFASVVLGILYYLTLNSAKNIDDTRANSGVPAPHQGGGIAMGQPQFPARANQDPVFVHEDTYMRRQFT